MNIPQDQGGRPCGFAHGDPLPDEPPDGEIQAMRDLVAVLEPFDNKTRRRMLEWLVAYQAEIPVACIPSPSRGEE